MYLTEAIPALRAKGVVITDEQIPHISPLGWEHIGVTGDYIWARKAHLPTQGLRPLRVLAITARTKAKTEETTVSGTKDCDYVNDRTL